MSLDTYENLKTAIQTYTGRNDISAILDDAIDITESYMYANPIEPLRIRNVETRSTALLTTTSRFLALPTDFVEFRRLKITFTDDPDLDLFFRTPNQLIVKEGTGIPRNFTVTSQLEFDVLPDDTYTLEYQYMARFTGLSSSNTTNNILTRFPQIYLHGCLWHIYGQYEGELEMGQNHHNEMINAIAGANRDDRSGRYGPAPVMRIKKAVP